VSNAQADPYPSHRFYIWIAQKEEPVAVFTEVSGLQIEMETQDHPEGGLNDYVHRLPGRLKVGNITLKRGLVASNALLQWVLANRPGSFRREDITIQLHGMRGAHVFSWNFRSAYPVKWVGPAFVSDATTAAVETFEFAHAGLTVEVNKPPPGG
jgi:phage tail-like protein